ERRRGIASLEAAEGRGDPLVRGGGDEDQRIRSWVGAEAGQSLSVLGLEVTGGELHFARGCLGKNVLEEDGRLAADGHGRRPVGRGPGPAPPAPPRGAR